MSILRTVFSVIFAGAVTFALFFLMHFLIEMNTTKPDDKPAPKIADFNMPEVKVEARQQVRKPDEPPEVEEPPPELPEQVLDTPDIDMSVNMNQPIAKSGIKIGGPGGIASDGEYLPIVKVQPTYPRRAAQRGLEGYCTVGYTVTTTGATRDPYEVDCPQKVFLRASLKAALKFKYKPRVIDGEPKEVPNVQNRFTFKMGG